MILQMRELSRDSIIQRNQLKVLQEVVSIMRLMSGRICGLQQKIQYQRNMTTHLKIFFNISMKRNMMKDLKRQILSIFIR